MLMAAFTIYPAIDLRKGQVVRLRRGDPKRQTTYSTDPAQVAARWLEAGARWLHVVNLDGAFGEADLENQTALKTILDQACLQNAQVQFGGGLRTLEGIESALRLGIHRLILGTAALETPELLTQVMQRYSAEQIVVALDTLQGIVRTRGWAQESGKEVLSVGKELISLGLRTVIYTNIKRDGMGSGVDIASAQALAALGLEVIASGGVRELEDIRQVRQAKLGGVILGRALYENALRLEEALELERR
jgi:phosphoribosylformimino-5-aminoimidazole carboxamide ribotide isomerase